MIDKTKAILVVTASALFGSAHAAVIYSNENFEGGTPNYTIDHTANSGAGSITPLQDGSMVNISATTAVMGTAFTAGSTSLMGIVASGQPANFSPSGTIPSGKHAFVSNSANRSLRLTNPMTLLTDGVQSINVSFAYLLYGQGSSDFSHALELVYSPSGFAVTTDSVQIATFGFLPATPAVPPGTHYPAVQDTWTTANLSIASTDVTFTNTANFRINKMAPQVLTQFVFLDDIAITGVVPEPSTTAFLGLAGFALMRRRRAAQAPRYTAAH
jgi:PEP-CTERM motif